MNAVSRLGNIFEDVAIKAPVRLASTAANITLSGLQTIDGVATAAGDRVLAAAQTDKTLNGIWQVATGPWLRPTDASKNTDFIDGTLVPVARGNVNAGKMFVLQCTDSPVAIGTSQLVFTAQSDVLAAQQSASSASSVAIGLGSKTFAIPAGKSFVASQYVLIYQTSNPANAMLGQISSYLGTSLVVTSVATGGAGTITDWTIVLANSPASAGRIPPLGTGNVAGPGSSVSGRLATFADGTGKVVQDSGVTPGTLAGRTTLAYGDAGTASIGDAALVSGGAPLPYFAAQPNDNLHLVNDVTNPTRDVNVTPGRCRDDSDVINLQLAGTMVKRLDTAWAAGGVAGSPVGGCDTGTKGASQTWHIFLIAKRNLSITSVSRTGNVATVTSTAHGLGVGGSARQYGIGSGFDGLAVITAVTANTYSFANTGVDVGATGAAGFADGFDTLASQTYSGPTMPSGWTVKQCLGSFLTDGAGNLRAVTQIGDEFLLATSVAVSTAGFGAVAVLTACPVPLGVKVFALLRADAQWSGGANSYILFSSPDETDQTPATGLATMSGNSPAAGTCQQGVDFICRVDTSGRVRHRVVGSLNALAASGKGWRDPRRRLF